MVEQNSDIKIIDPVSNDSEYQEHIKTYWKTLISLPSSENPYYDETGEKTTNSQTSFNSSIFFLSGGRNQSTRTCKVSHEKGIFIPVMTVEVSVNELNKKNILNADNDTLHRIAKKDQDSVTSLYLKINDVEYTFEDLKKYRKHTDVFDVEFPEQPIFEADPGNSNAVADGYCIITEPLLAGQYTIHMKGSLECSGTDCFEPGFSKDIKYILTVE